MSENLTGFQPTKQRSVLRREQFSKVLNAGLGIAATGAMILGARANAPQQMDMQPETPHAPTSQMVVHTGGDQLTNFL